MDRKIKVLVLITIVVAAVVGTALVFAAQPVKGQVNNPASDVQQPIQPAISSLNATNWNGTIGGFMGFGGQGQRQFGRGFNGFGGFGGNYFNGTGNCFNGTNSGFGIQVSSAYTQNVTSVLNSSSDVQALFSEGYNVTSIQPILTRTIDGNGNVITQATTANVVLQGPNGRALVVVDLTTGKVTKIITTTVNNNPS